MFTTCATLISANHIARNYRNCRNYRWSYFSRINNYRKCRNYRKYIFLEKIIIEIVEIIESISFRIK